ncbi:hypothetical protein [Singulisphaera acidiphila]|uniref:Uncharacterized protein n=1 Tax=Singulisphaera acidiphila (strain ATCC BAA-1392 / DSM 18658 / VKM B-2454 / MOB10) TaxID=886293 RepID=L0D8C6_SINAD|nr:hypothetical protein [Singulisphaera acidiphila]AGA25088.1 hypothetical protein Sinac_0676 [Singulisphaera acidiphila DSM 18658]
MERTEIATSVVSDQRIRRFTLLDLMILVGAMAVGFGLLRLPGIEFSTWYSKELRYNRIALNVVGMTVPFLVGLTISCLAMRLRGPCPRFSMLGRQPGFVACATALLALAIESLCMVGNAVTSGVHSANRGFFPTPEEYFHLYGSTVAPWVVAAWLSLGVNRCWCPERSGIDRLGWAIGIAWILEWIVMRLCLC